MDNLWTWMFSMKILTRKTLWRGWEVVTVVSMMMVFKRIFEIYYPLCNSRRIILRMQELITKTNWSVGFAWQILWRMTIWECWLVCIIFIRSVLISGLTPAKNVLSAILCKKSNESWLNENERKCRRSVEKLLKNYVNCIPSIYIQMIIMVYSLQSKIFMKIV